MFPTFAEGLGLPPIQAAQCAIPVVVSNLSVFEETVGPVAVTVDPADPGAIAAGMRRAAGDSVVRSRAQTAAPAFRARFSLEACIGDHVAVYRSVAARQHASA
jgi:glycosyltransferase involved in cell wall biosynthesis